MNKAIARSESGRTSWQTFNAGTVKGGKKYMVLTDIVLRPLLNHVNVLLVADAESARNSRILARKETSTYHISDSLMNRGSIIAII